MAKPYKRKPRKFTDEQLDALDLEFRICFTDLMTAWATCESCLRGVLAHLLRVDLWRSDLVMYSIMSTRARMEIINRLALLTLDDRRTRHLAKLCREFKSVTELRNRLAHSIYTYKITRDGAGDIGIVIGGTFVNFQKPNYNNEAMYEDFKINRNLFNEMRQMTKRALSLAYRFRHFDRGLSKKPSAVLAQIGGYQPPEPERRKTKPRRQRPSEKKARKRPR